MTDGYKFHENINQPLGLQYNCVSVFDNVAKVMIKIQHGVHLLLVFDEAKVPNIGS